MSSKSDAHSNQEAAFNPSPELLESYADLIVNFAANVQSGRPLAITSEPGKEALTRAIATEAYKAGASYVEPVYFDPHVKRARILHAEHNTLSYVPPWLGQRALQLGEARGSIITLRGPVSPGLMNDVNPERAALDKLPSLPETKKITNEGLVSWTVVPSPTPLWAKQVYPDLEPADAYRQLWEEVRYVCRLDEDDPVAAWTERQKLLGDVGKRLTDLRLDSLHFQGPGTDLRVGLLPSSRWKSTLSRTAEGIIHFANIPSEEIYTAPDPERVEGYVRSTRPAVIDDMVISGLRLRFERGKATVVDAEQNGGMVAKRMQTDAGACRLGEIALVDGSGRVGRKGVIYFVTLLDENAASHAALGDTYTDTIGETDLARVNKSAIHQDFMIGSPEVQVTGIKDDGRRIPVLYAGQWQI